MITTGAGLLIRENSWVHRLFPPCICIFLANTYCGSEIAASAVRTTATSPQYTKISGQEQTYFAARWKTPGIRPINLRSWNWFAGFNHRELFLTGVALSFPRLVSSRLVSSRFLLGLARDHPLTILGIFLAPLCREFDVVSRRSLWNGYLLDAFEV